MGQVKLMTNIILVSLFTLAILGFAVNFASDNDSRISLADDDQFASARATVDTNTKVLHSNANTSVKAMMESTISSQSDATEGGTAFKVGVLGLASTLGTTVSTSYSRIFGSDSEFTVFFTAFISLISMIAIFYLYKTWRGNPD